MFCGLKKLGYGHGVMTKMPTMCKACVNEINDFLKNLLSPLNQANS